MNIKKEESFIEKCDRLEEENERLKETIEQMINKRIREIDERNSELRFKMMLEERWNKIIYRKMSPAATQPYNVGIYE